MCLFIYTLPQLCNHLTFQNVSECAVARGMPSSQEKASLTLQEPVFLFDTMHSRSHTPEFYTHYYSCKKRKAIRPVPTLCEQCGGGGGGDGDGEFSTSIPRRTSASTSSSSLRRQQQVGIAADHHRRPPVVMELEAGLRTEERLLLAVKPSARSLNARSYSSSGASTYSTRSLGHEADPMENV